MRKIFEALETDDGLVTRKNVRIGAALLSAAVCLVSVFFTRDTEFLLGLFTGSAVAQLLFRQHELSIDRMLSSGNTGKGTADYMIRFLIRAAAVAAAAGRGIVCAAGCIIGLLTVSYSIYALAFIENARIGKSGKKEEE